MRWSRTIPAWPGAAASRWRSSAARAGRRSGRCARTTCCWRRPAPATSFPDTTRRRRRWRHGAGAGVARGRTPHARIWPAAEEAGKPVGSDKPLATDVAEAAAVVAAVERAGVTFTYVHRLYSPGLQRARAAVDRGEV